MAKSKRISVIQAVFISDLSSVCIVNIIVSNSSIYKIIKSVKLNADIILNFALCLKAICTYRSASIAKFTILNDSSGNISFFISCFCKRIALKSSESVVSAFAPKTGMEKRPMNRSTGTSELRILFIGVLLYIKIRYLLQFPKQPPFSHITICASSADTNLIHKFLQFIHECAYIFKFSVYGSKSHIRH